MKPRTRGQLRVAFTLIELLVVIAIIAIVTTMLLPRLSGSRKPRLLLCLNNLRQVSLGYLLWSSSNNNFFPWEVSTNASGSLELIGRGLAADHFALLAPYLRNPATLSCPADRARLSASSYARFSNTKVTSCPRTLHLAQPLNPPLPSSQETGTCPSATSPFRPVYL